MMLCISIGGALRHDVCMRVPKDGRGEPQQRSPKSVFVWLAAELAQRITPAWVDHLHGSAVSLSLYCGGRRTPFDLFIGICLSYGNAQWPAKVAAMLSCFPRAPPPAQCRRSSQSLVLRARRARGRPARLGRERRFRVRLARFACALAMSMLGSCVQQAGGFIEESGVQGDAAVWCCRHARRFAETSTFSLSGALSSYATGRRTGEMR